MEGFIRARLLASARKSPNHLPLMHGDVTQLLSALGQGHSHAVSRLLPLVYEELHRLAAQRMPQKLPGHTFQLTDLVHAAHPLAQRAARIVSGLSVFFSAPVSKRLQLVRCVYRRRGTGLRPRLRNCLEYHHGEVSVYLSRTHGAPRQADS